MTTIYIYSNETGEQVGLIEGDNNADCEAKAVETYGINDYHFSYLDQPLSDVS